MKRDLEKSLLKWKTQVGRKPLLLRGARQVGKSWLVREFARSFDSVVEINFERDKSAKTLFEGDLHIPRLLERLSLYAGSKIIFGKTLLFLDEIQECEAALSALRYFKEDCPELHVIAAGSLVEFALEKLGMPVGRIQFLYLYPLSFAEYLTAINREDLRQHILEMKVDTAVHDQLIDTLKTYLWLGGMPAVVQAWLDQKDIQLCQRLQDELIQTYRQDFLKYARRKRIEHLDQVFSAIPTQLGQKFTFSRVNPHLPTYALKEALGLLIMASVALPTYHSSGQGIPLGAGKNEKKFKVYFLDVGLAQRILGLDSRSWAVEPLTVINIGPVAEQYVAQEWLSHMDPALKPELYYWHREAPASSAEVDLLAVKEGTVIPVEVKSGVRGGLKSLHLFLQSHPNSPFGLKVSENRFASHGPIREVPLYGIEAWIKSRPRSID